MTDRLIMLLFSFSISLRPIITELFIEEQ